MRCTFFSFRSTLQANGYKCLQTLSVFVFSRHPHGVVHYIILLFMQTKSYVIYTYYWHQKKSIFILCKKILWHFLFMNINYDVMFTWSCCLNCYTVCLFLYLFLYQESFVYIEKTWTGTISVNTYQGCTILPHWSKAFSSPKDSKLPIFTKILVSTLPREYIFSTKKMNEYHNYAKSPFSPNVNVKIEYILNWISKFRIHWG